MLFAGLLEVNYLRILLLENITVKLMQGILKLNVFIIYYLIQLVLQQVFFDNLLSLNVKFFSIATFLFILQNLFVPIYTWFNFISQFVFNLL